ncbi:MAG: FxLYD domain-containing protein [Dehalococcoidales bacterium]|jgi:P pilus assembly chaperone PapD
MKSRLAISAGILLLLLLAGMASCIHVGEAPAKAEITVIKKELKTDGQGGTALYITVKNTGGVNAELAQVTVSFYDTQKNLVYTARDSVLNLKPGQIWDFTLPCAGECGNIGSYEVETLAGSSSGGL